MRGYGPAARSLAAASLSVFGACGIPPREPYVQEVSATSATIAWVGWQPGVGRVEYGRRPGPEGVVTDLRVLRRHAVTLHDLAPDSTYYYEIEKDDGSRAAGSFRTAPVGAGSSFVFAVIGDSGDGGTSQMAVAGLLERSVPDLVLHTGDVVYPSGRQRHYDRRYFAPYGKLIGSVPVFPVPGNHDVKTKNGAAYLENFHLPFGDPGGGGRYYSFDWGDAHFAALDSELYHEDTGADPVEQKVWLERDLAATRRRWKFVFLHRPLYSSSKHGGDSTIRRDLEPVFVNNGVNLVFSGHDHCYERTLPIKGVTYVVSGGGGKTLYPAGKSKWTARSVSAHHAVLVHIEGERLSLEALEPDGAILDHLDFGRR